MVAVFGAMSLTPSPAAAQATPNVSVEAYVGDTDPRDVNIIPYLNGRQGDFSGFGTVVVTPPDQGQADHLMVVNTNAFGIIGIRVTAAADANVGEYTITVPARFNTGRFIEVIVGVEILAATPATAVDEIPEQRVAIKFDPVESTMQVVGDAVTVDLTKYFAAGKGTGSAITAYVPEVEVASAGAVADRLQATALADTDLGGLTLIAQDAAEVGESYRVTVTGQDGVTTSADPVQRFYVEIVAEGAGTGDSTGPTGPIDPDLPKLTPDSTEPGDGTRYDIEFQTTADVNTLTDELTIKLDDFELPSTIATRSVAIIVKDDDGENRDFIPEDVTVSGSKVIITLGDMDKGDDIEDFDISGGSTIKVVLRKSAGISNPSESKSYGPVITLAKAVKLDWEEENDDGNPMFPGLELKVPRIISLDEEDGGRGDEIIVTGKGYKDGTTVTFWRDEMTPVMWNKGGSSTDNDDKVWLLLSDKEEYETVVEANSKRGSHALPLPATDNTLPFDDDDNSNTVRVDALVAPNGAKDSNEERLCSAVADGQDVASCEFEVTNPPFLGGDTSNYVNGVDGRGNSAHKGGDDDQRFLLLPSISATPNGGSPGEVMLVQLADFPAGVGVDKVQLSRRDICGGLAVNASGNAITCQGSTDGSGNVNISVVIPNWAEPGKQELRVFTADDGDDNITVDISGPVITPTPRMVVANQRVSLVGSGFFAGAKIGDCDDCGNAAITIGGDQIAWARINGNDDVNVDNGGNWSAAVDLPLTSATTASGRRTIRVTDSKGRTGTVDITIPGREVTITPTTGRVGTQAVVRGKYFPSKNDDGDSFNVVIIYDAGNGKQATVTAVPDASGEFETPLRIPTTAGIPSTNTVKVEFDDFNNVKVVTTVTHDVPEGAINLSADSGSSGSKVTISGEGFKAFVPVQSVKVGNIEVTPSPNPSTDGQGMLGFEITIPGLDNGIQTVEVKVSGTTASEGFTVRPSGVSAGDIKASAEAIVNLGENFIRSFNFNNDTKSWTFYSPEAPDDSTQTSFITGESYWILIGESQQVILNGKTRNLTCASDNCWNQIVW